MVKAISSRRTLKRTLKRVNITKDRHGIYVLRGRKLRHTVDKNKGDNESMKIL